MTTTSTTVTTTPARTASPDPAARPKPTAWWSSSHRHTRRCWWNMELPGWVCAEASPSSTPAGPRSTEQLR